MPNTRADPYAAIKNKIPLLINSISNLPDCPVWIHKRALYKVLKLTSGPTYGQRDVLDCLMRGIEKGFCGNMQRDFIPVDYVDPDFSRENSSGRISWQYNGRHETFLRGSLSDEKVARPRWFKIAEPVTDVATQMAIVEQLLGEACGLPEDVIHEHPHHEELSPSPLIHEPQSSKWGQYIYTDSTMRPADDKRWYDLISSCHEDIIHWWRQFRLDSTCLLRDLQYLSNNTRGVQGKNIAPLLAFKEDFPILFECIYAVFGLMMSHSRLCESVHGMMRHYLRYDIGMDQIDAQRSHMVTTEYEMRERRRKILVMIMVKMIAQRRR